MSVNTRYTVSNISRRLMMGTAIAGLALSATSALAQNASETVVVTGTSIRGQAPVGANIISVDRDAIVAQGAQTAQQLLASVPQLAGFGNAAQGGIGSYDGSGAQAPTIHSLGASASNTTLVLIDGHRIPLSGLNHALGDPSVIPAAAIQRVEILPDGASAVYGSDAMAGVLNFITRKDYTGWETSAQYGIGDSYNTFQASQLFGHSWDGGSVLAVYNYSNRSRLMMSDRAFATSRQDLRHGSATANPNTGGSNFDNFNCGPASITASQGSSTVSIYPYTGATLSTSTAAQQGQCNTDNVTSLLPGEVRDNALVSLRQALNDSIVLTADLVYSSRLGEAASSRGTVSGSVFGPGSGKGNQINPFYVAAPNIASTAGGTEYVRYNVDDLLGPGFQSTKSGAQDAFATLGLEADLGGNWAASLGTTFGTDNSFQRSNGQLNTASALLALNGTVASNGSPSATNGVLADPYGLGSVYSVTRSLNTSNALDVWNPTATNRTSQAVKNSLLDNNNNNTATQNLQDVSLKFDGPLLTLPAGDLKVAIGAEYIHYTLDQRNTSPNGAGPASSSSRLRALSYNRTVWAGFGELVVPVVNQDMDIPLVQKLDLDFSGRVDHYSDFGTTKNPKVGLTWDIVDGLRARATYGTSFTAPSLTSVGQPGTGVTGETGLNIGGVPNNQVIPYTWAGIAGTWVENPTTCAAGGGTATATGCQINTSTNPGLILTGGNAGLKPETGLTYSVGLDINFGAFVPFLKNLTANITYWQAKSLGLITAPAFGSTIPLPTLQVNTVFAPPGGWAPSSAYIQGLVTGRPLSASLPATIWSVFDYRQQNAFNVQANGLDYQFNYALPTDTMGTFNLSVAGSNKLRFDANSGPSTVAWTDYLNGVNRSTTFNAIAWTMRTTLGWDFDPFSVRFSWNYVNAYHARNSNPPYNAAAPDGSRLAGYEHIAASNTFDLNVGYNIPEEWWSGTRANLTITNLFDSDPSFSNQSSGYDGGGSPNGNPIGRVVTIGVTKKW